MILKKLLNIYKRFVLKKSKEQLEIEYLVEHGMKLGKNSNIYSASTIDNTWPWLISIGDNVTISTNVTILAHDASTNVVNCGTKLGKVSIGDNVFIGTGVTILCNTMIGNNVIVGARSLVTSNLPDDGVYAGIPAKRICSIQEYRDKYQQLRKESYDFSNIRPWYDWNNSSEDERKRMVDELGKGIGFI